MWLDSTGGRNAGLVFSVSSPFAPFLRCELHSLRPLRTGARSQTDDPVPVHHTLSPLTVRYFDSRLSSTRSHHRGCQEIATGTPARSPSDPDVISNRVRASVASVRISNAVRTAEMTRPL